MHKILAAMLVGVAGGTLLLQATAAGAATLKPVPRRAIATTAPATHLAAPDLLTAPRGYTIVNSGPLTAVPGTQTNGQVLCPGTEVPSGGGAIVDSDALTLNSSYPAGSSWQIYVNNPTGEDIDFNVYAVCLHHSASYTVVTAPGSVADSTQSAAADCPAHTTVLGGGAVSDSGSTDVGINSTVPNQLTGSHTAWRVAMSSGDSTLSDFTVYAICRAKPTGYSIQFGPVLDNPPFSVSTESAACPAGSLAIGGGGFTGFQTSDTAILANSTWPEISGNGWGITETNNGSIGRSLEAAVICAGT